MLDIGDELAPTASAISPCESSGVVGFLDAGCAPQPLDFRGKRRVDVERRALHTTEYHAQTY